MVDVHDTQTRHKNMSAIRNSNTKPEQIVANLLTELELSFQPQLQAITGKPDFFIENYNTAIFVNGCFWHGHDCHLFKIPQTRTDFWLAKIKRNKERDRKVTSALRDANIRQLIIWECSLKGCQKLETAELKARIEEFLISLQQYAQIRESGFSLISEKLNTEDKNPI